MATCPHGQLCLHHMVSQFMPCLTGITKGVSKNIEIEYFDEAANWLLNHPKVDENGIGILGSCTGGMLGFLLATRMKDKVKAVTGKVSLVRFLQ